MSSSYVFLLSRKKSGELNSGFSLNPAERSRDNSFPQRSQSFSTNPAINSSPYSRATRQNYVIDSNSRRNDVISPDNLSVNSTRNSNYSGPTSAVNPRLRPSSAPRVVNDVTTSGVDGNFDAPRKYNRRTTPGSQFGPIGSYAESQTLPSRKSSRANGDERSNIGQPIEVKAKTWTRLSSNNLASMCDSSSNLSIPSLMHGARGDDRSGSRTRLNTQSVNDLRLRGSRTEINVPIGPTRGREYSTSTTELAMRTSANSRVSTTTYTEAPNQEPRNRTRPKFNSTTSLQIRQDNKHEEFNDDLRDRRGSFGPVNNFRSGPRGHRDLDLETTDSGLEAALERAKQKRAANGTDQRKISSTVLHVNNANGISIVQNDSSVTEIQGRPVAASRLVSDPLFDPTMPRLIPPSNRLAASQTHMLNGKSDNSKPADPSSNMRSYSFDNQSVPVRQQFNDNTFRPSVSFNDPRESRFENDLNFSQPPSGRWKRPVQSDSSRPRVSFDQSDGSNPSRPGKNYVIGETSRDQNLNQWTSLERQNASSISRSVTNERRITRHRTTSQEHSSENFRHNGAINRNVTRPNWSSANYQNQR